MMLEDKSEVIFSQKTSFSLSREKYALISLDIIEVFLNNLQHSSILPSICVTENSLILRIEGKKCNYQEGG